MPPPPKPSMRRGAHNWYTDGLRGMVKNMMIHGTSGVVAVCLERDRTGETTKPTPRGVGALQPGADNLANIRHQEEPLGKTMITRTIKLVPERATSREQARGHERCCEEVVWAGSLHEATRCGHKTIVANILENGAPPDAKDEGGSTALHIAAGVGEVGMVELLLLKGAALEAQDGAERRPVHVAAQAGHVGVTGALLAAGADAGARYGTYQWSALQVAADNGRAGDVKVLIGHGVNVNTADTEGSTPLHCVVYGGSVQVIDALAKAGAKIISKECPRGYTSSCWGCLAPSRSCSRFVEVWC